MAGMQGLGRLFDIGTGFVPVDLNTADGATPMRLSLSNATGVTFIFFKGVAAGGTDDIVLDVQQHTAYTGGTSNDMDSANGATGITKYWVKSETALDNDESWVEVSQSEASEVTLAGATYAAKQAIVAIYVAADQLADGFGWVSLNCTVTGLANAELACCLYLLHDLAVQRKPANLGNLLRPGAANA